MEAVPSTSTSTSPPPLHPFRWLPTLQHMASVKIIENLWMNVLYMDWITDACMEKGETGTRVSFSNFHRPTLQTFEEFVDTLHIPKYLATHVKNMISEMLSAVLAWFECSDEFDGVMQPPNLEKKVEHFVLIRWTNLGVIDFRTMLKTFVADKPVVDPPIWNLLCCFCLEEEILRLGKSMKWRKCLDKLDSFYFPYWYQKATGKFPPQRLFPTTEEYLFFKSKHYKGYYSNQLPDAEYAKKMMWLSLSSERSHRIKSADAFFYFEKMADDAAFTEQLIKDWGSRRMGHRNQHIEMILPILRRLDREVCIANWPNSAGFMLLLPSWPWTMFIDHWICLLENIDCVFFTHYFISSTWRDDANEVTDEPFWRIWRVFYERFKADDDKLCKQFGRMFYKGNLSLTSAMMRGLDGDERIRMIKLLEMFADKKSTTGRRLLPENEFFVAFSDSVLRDEGERLLLQAACRYVPHTNQLLRDEEESDEDSDEMSTES